MSEYTHEKVIARLKAENQSLIKKNKILSKENTAYRDLIAKINGQTMRAIHDD